MQKKLALLTVSDKTGIVDLARFLLEQGFELVSTGGTARRLGDAGVATTPVQDITGKSEAFGGRVKTLDFAIEAGILYRRDNASDRADTERMGIRPIDIVVCNFYPFEAVAERLARDTASGQGLSSEALARLIENIDIGGPTLLRSAAKNYRSCIALSSPNQYAGFMQEFSTDVDVYATAADTANPAQSGSPNLLGKTAKRATHFLREERRLALAREAFARCARYNAAIERVLAGLGQAGFAVEASSVGGAELAVEADLPFEARARNLLRRMADSAQGDAALQGLRYGENPHQQAALLPLGAGLAQARVLQGKALSYNNFLDADVAWKCASEADRAFSSQVVCIVKHGNPCGFAVGAGQTFADSAEWNTENETRIHQQEKNEEEHGSANSAASRCLSAAWNCDPVSSFGSVIASNKEVDAQFARWLADKFVEIVIAPSFSEQAQEVFAQKKNLRLLESPPKTDGHKEIRTTSINGGILVQEEDESLAAERRVVSRARFPEESEALVNFGIIANKYAKSNAISVVARYGEHMLLLGAGCGQANRVDSLALLAVPRAVASLERFAAAASEGSPPMGTADAKTPTASLSAQQAPTLAECLLISDAFFPFPDSIEAAARAGIRYIVQPGGSLRDSEVIDACNEHSIAMCFTGTRHFRH